MARALVRISYVLPHELFWVLLSPLNMDIRFMCKVLNINYQYVNVIFACETRHTLASDLFGLF